MDRKVEIKKMTLACKLQETAIWIAEKGIHFTLKEMVCINITKNRNNSVCIATVFQVLFALLQSLN